MYFLGRKHCHFTRMYYLCKRFEDKGFPLLEWRDGRVVDCGGLENRWAERLRGFESLSLRRMALRFLQNGHQKSLQKQIIVVGSRSYNDFSLYAVHRLDGLPLEPNSHQSVKFCYRNCYTKLDVAISVAVTAVTLDGKAWIMTRRKNTSVGRE